MPANTTSRVLYVVSKYTETDTVDLLGRSKNRYFSMARNIAFYLLYRTGHSQVSICRIFRRGQSTVSMAISRIEALRLRPGIMRRAIINMELELNLQQLGG